MSRKCAMKRMSTLGRRTGLDVVAGKHIRVGNDGRENFSDYWTSSEEEDSARLCSSPANLNAPRMSSFLKNHTPDKELPDKISFVKSPPLKNHPSKQLPIKRKLTIGRRTGIDIYAGKKIRKVNGYENFDDYFTESSVGSGKTFSASKTKCVSLDSQDSVDEVPKSSHDTTPRGGREEVLKKQTSPKRTPRGGREEVLKKQTSPKRTPRGGRVEVLTKQTSPNRTPRKLLHDDAKINSTPKNHSSGRGRFASPFQENRKPSTRSSFKGTEAQTPFDNVSTQTSDKSLLRLKVTGETQTSEASITRLEKTGVGVATQTNANSLLFLEAESDASTASPQLKKLHAEKDVSSEKKGRSPIVHSPLNEGEMANRSGTRYSSKKKTSTSFKNRTESLMESSVRKSLAVKFQEEGCGSSRENLSDNETPFSNVQYSPTVSHSKLKPKQVDRITDTEKSSSSFSHSNGDKSAANESSHSKANRRDCSVMSEIVGARLDYLQSDQEEVENTVLETVPVSAESHEPRLSGSQSLPPGNSPRSKSIGKTSYTVESSSIPSKKSERSSGNVCSPHPKSSSGKKSSPQTKKSKNISRASSSMSFTLTAGLNLQDSDLCENIVRGTENEEKTSASSSPLRNHDSSQDNAPSPCSKVTTSEKSVILRDRKANSTLGALNSSKSQEASGLSDLTKPALAATKTKGRKKLRPVPAEDADELKSQLRRSTRKRFPPLESWRNQRLHINWKEGEIVDVELEEGSAPDNSHLDLIRKREQYQKLRLAKKAKLTDNSTTRKGVQDCLKEMTVLNPMTGEEEHVYLHRPHDSLLWTIPPLQSKKNAEYTISKCFSGEFISFGFIEIGPGKEKREQHSPDHNIAFTVVKGSSIKMKIYKTVLYLKEHDFVIVPVGNSYSLRNKGSKLSLISYSLFKAPAFDFQFPGNRNDED